MVTSNFEMLCSLCDKAKVLQKAGYISNTELGMLLGARKRAARSRSGLTKTEQIINAINMACAG